MFESMLRINLSILIIFCFTSVFSQTPYGNDWINPSQQYYKIKVPQKGIYRLNYNTLSQKIPTLSSFNPKQFQLFKNGKEVAIYVQGEGDNSFDSNDFIEFYGEPNDGTLDKELYPISGDQPHNYYSLFTDTAAYFLTVNTTPGKRIQNFKASKTGLTAETHVIQESLGIYAESYYPGKYIIAHMSLTDYQTGEGFLGNMYGRGEQQSRTIATPNLYIGTDAPVIKLETYVAGRSDAQATSPLGNHHIKISVNNGTATYLKKDTIFRSYDIVRKTMTLAPNEIGTQTQIIYESINDLGAESDYQAVGFAQITYPRAATLQNTNALNFKLAAKVGQRLLNFSSNNKANPIIWDLNAEQRVVGDLNGGNAEFVLSTTSNERNLFLNDSTAYLSPEITKVEMLNLSPNTFDKNFIIITHKSLLASAQNYLAYRQQTGYKPFLVTTEQLYDQFYYGVHHPLAIRNFAKYLLQYASTKPEYLLLLGKGLENNLIRSSNGLNADLVPTYGSPPSDDLLTARINTTSLAPAITTGRVVAKDNAEVEIYLQKLKNYEKYDNALWRKKFIHVSGGNNLSENLSWATYQKNMYNQAKEAPFGADTVNFHKNVTLPVSNTLKQQIVTEINNGAALLSFIGHGSHQATEIDFGIPEELNNGNKLLTYLVNGCTTGNTYIIAPSLAEKHLLYPEKGAIGWIGTSSEGIASYLSNFSLAFYKNAFTTNYGVSIAHALKLAKAQYQNFNDVINVMHTTQYTFQGDPALKFYTPQKPDFAVGNQDLFMATNNVTALDTEFSIAIVVKNIAKAVNQPLKISLTRTLPDNSTITYPIQTFTKPVYNTDTLYFKIEGNDATSAGINKFTISLDPQGEFDELSKSNNTASFDFNISSNGINVIYPKKYAIVPQTDTELVAQSNDLLIKNANYIFEIDTVKTFNSPWHKTTNITTGFMPKWRPTLLPTSNQTYFWRVRLNVDIDKGGAWQESTFTYIQDSPDGWNQSNYQHFINGQLTSLEFNNNTKKLEFAKTAFSTTVQTRGDDGPTTEERRYRANPGGALGFRYDQFTGFTILALNPATMRPFNYPSTFNHQNQDDTHLPLYYSGQFYYDINNPVEVDSLVAYLNKIPDGFHVIGYNGYGINLSALPEYAKNAFLQVGVINIGSIASGEAYMFWGQKGAVPGSAVEKSGSRSDVIRFSKVYTYPLTQGIYVTEKAGPAMKWKSVTYDVRKDATDVVTYDLIGYGVDGAMRVLQVNLPSNTLNLDGFDAKVYPKMAIRANFKDATNRTPAQLLTWKFLYDEYSEASINPEIKNNFYSNKVQEGDSIKWEIAYQNLSNYPSDAVDVYYTLTKPDRSVINTKLGKIESVAVGQSATINLKIPTMGLVGNNLLKLDFTPINGNDSYAFNNYLQEKFTVTRDSKEPIVDVAFDGKHIMNGEIVSPKPNIIINMTDENSYRLLNDTTLVSVFIKSATGNYKRATYKSGLLNFTPASSNTNNKASVFYKPEKLQDGTYTLMVEGKDATGNINNIANYTIDFEVINESAITHFYPYPNPFTTAMKFVFTLTGDKVPDKIKVQIMTITGKIVREIFKEELGIVRIGHNISDFTWDGTDMYGDRLANGIYFYKVTVENNDRTVIKHRTTITDNFFKQNTGKIYLMR